MCMHIKRRLRGKHITEITLICSEIVATKLCDSAAINVYSEAISKRETTLAQWKQIGDKNWS